MVAQKLACSRNGQAGGIGVRAQHVWTISAAHHAINGLAIKAMKSPRIFKIITRQLPPPHQGWTTRSWRPIVGLTDVDLQRHIALKRVGAL